MKVFPAKDREVRHIQKRCFLFCPDCRNILLFSTSAAGPVCRLSTLPVFTRKPALLQSMFTLLFSPVLKNAQKLREYPITSGLFRHQWMTCRFPPYPLIWAEGSIFIIGVEQGIKLWKKFLKPGGFLGFTEATRFTKSPPEKVRSFWQENYPGMNTVDEINTLANRAGYTCIADFPLPASAWWVDYYMLPPCLPPCPGAPIPG
jgi:hypothetical protein